MNEAEQLQWLEQHNATVEFKREFVKVRVEVGMSHAFYVRGNTLLAAIVGIQQLQEGYNRASRQQKEQGK
jgi:hypothetical protein